MKNIIVFGGSTSVNSINKKLAVYAASFLDDVKIHIIDFNDYETKLFSVDEEKNGFPKEILALQKEFAKADGFVISLAEHNGSYAAAYKNNIDWLSRVNRNVFNEKPMLLMSTSPGGGGGVHVFEAAKNYYPRLGAQITSTFVLPKFNENFKENELITAAYQNELLDAVKEFRKNL